MKFFKKQRAIEQLIAVILIWMSVVVVRAALLFLKGSTLTTPFPASELTDFMDWKLLGSVLVGGAIVFSAFKAFGHRAKESEKKNADQYADLALDEIGGVLYNFGALMAVCAYVGETKLLYLGVFVLWIIGYTMKPSEQVVVKAETQIHAEG